MSSRFESLTVPWLFDGLREPQRHGALVWTDGRLTQVGPAQAVDPPAATVAFPPGLADELSHSADWAVLPGLINGHTHLEFSDLDEPLPPPAPFVDWLANVIRSRRNRTLPAGEAIRRGLDESARFGVTSIADILTADWSDYATAWNGLNSAAAPRTIPFRELLGLRPDQKEGQLARADEHLRRIGEGGSGLAGGGLSPHAPYSVHPELVEALIGRATAAGRPVAMHLAETAEEMELLATGRGPFVEFLERLGVWHPPAFPGPVRPLDFLARLARAPRALVVHGNYLAEHELEFLAGHPGLTLVYCPRTHAYFGHPPHPWKSLMRLGGRVILGTDSRASNPDLDLFEEAKFLAARHPDVPGSDLLAMITRGGAEGLFGNEADCGVLAPGRRADLALVRLPAGKDDPWERLFHPESRVLATLVAGRWYGTDVSPAR